MLVKEQLTAPLLENVYAKPVCGVPFSQERRRMKEQGRWCRPDGTSESDNPIGLFGTIAQYVHT